MKFTFFKEFRVAFGLPVEQKFEAIFTYLRRDLTKTFRELSNGLNRLRFVDNFESFEVSVTVAANSTLSIQNELGQGRIPTKMIIVNGDGRDITTDKSVWTVNNVSVTNNHATNSRTVTLLFLV